MRECVSGRGPPRTVYVLFVATLVALVYLPGLRNGFVWIDEGEILRGRLIIHDFDELVNTLIADRNYAGYHRPVNNMIHTLNLALWRENPFGFHLTSLLLHVANVALAFCLMQGLGHKDVPAATAALLWGIHPVNAESVGLISVVQNVAVLTLLLGAANLFLVSRTSEKRALLTGLSCLSYTVALFTKEFAVVYPLLVWVFYKSERTNGKRQTKEHCLRYATLVWVITGVAIAGRTFLTPMASYHSPMPLWERLLTFLGVYVDYVGKLVLPVNLLLSDTVTRFTSLSASQWMLDVIGFSVLLAIQGVLWITCTRTRAWIASFNVLLLPVAQVIPILHFKADRYLYVPSLVFVWACVGGASMWMEAAKEKRDLLRYWAGLGMVGVTLGYGELTVQRLRTFENDETLFRYEVAKVPDYREGLCMLGREYDRQGARARAEEYYRRCIAAYPGRISYVDFGAAVINLSHNLLSQDRPREAYDIVERFEGVVTDPDRREELSYNRAVALYRLRRYEDALPLFLAYAANHPDDASCWFLAGVSSFELEEYQIARGAFKAYLALRPGAADRDIVEGFLETIDARR